MNKIGFFPAKMIELSNLQEEFAPDHTANLIFTTLVTKDIKQ